MEAVFRSQLEPREKLVALALADFADDDGGNVYPSIKTLADKVSMSAGNVRRIVRQLEKIGYARLVGNDMVARRHVPRDQLRVLQAFAEVRQGEDGHAKPIARRAAAAIRCVLGR